MPNVVRQGDLLFVPCSEMPAESFLKERTNGVIAEGEATGHHHRIAVLEDATVLETARGYRAEPEVFLRVGPKGIAIVHEEHKSVTLLPDTLYKVHRAREYDYLHNVSFAARD